MVPRVAIRRAALNDHCKARNMIEHQLTEKWPYSIFAVEVVGIRMRGRHERYL